VDLELPAPGARPVQGRAIRHRNDGRRPIGLHQRLATLTRSSDILEIASIRNDVPPAPGKIGVLLVNLGTPDSPDYLGVRRFLASFLSDRRVVELPRALWGLILHLCILPFRPWSRSRDYAAIWNWGRDESPLKSITRSQAEKLAAWLEAGGLEDQGHRPGSRKIVVGWAMRHGNPALAVGLRKLKEAGCGRILVVPLYPQYAGAATGSVHDAVYDALRPMRWQPALRIAPPYYSDPTYIEVLATSLRARLAKLDFVPDMILVSFHGIPKAQVDKGDPYLDQCLETWRLLREHLRLGVDRCPITFQSRFGKSRWLEPATDSTIRVLAEKGVKSLVVTTPGFASDCLETLYELGVENRALFEANGGENFAVVPCLNDSELGMMVIYELVARELAGWA
jgi:ferrochelatase